MSVKTHKISDIDIDIRDTWENKVFLTFDIDWVVDEVIADTLDLIRQHAASNVTFFVTHDSPLIQDMRSDSNIELGIHPNFNPLLDNKGDKNADEVIQDLLSIVPEAVSVRSHSLTQSSLLYVKYQNTGLQFECSNYLPYDYLEEVRPWRALNGLVKVPHTWEDDIAVMNHKLDVDFSSLLSNRGVIVFDFHPIHIFINTTSIEHYQSAKEVFYDPVALRKQRQTSEVGVRDKFIELLSKL